MPILLNDPDAAGGSTAIDLSADGWVFGTYSAAVLKRCFDAINANFAELYRVVGTNLQSYKSVAFSTSVPADNTYVMPDVVVTGPLAFELGANPANGCGCQLNLTADGNSAHIPTFEGTAISGWINTVGVVNCVNFGYGPTPTSGGALVATAYSYQYSGNWPLSGPPLAPAVTSLALTHGANPVLVIGIGGSGLNPAYVPALSAFSVSGSDGVVIGPGPAGLASSKVTVTEDSIQIPLFGAVAAGDVVTLNYTPPADGALQDANGIRMGAITAATVTAS